MYVNHEFASNKTAKLFRYGVFLIFLGGIFVRQENYTTKSIGLFCRIVINEVILQKILRQHVLLQGISINCVQSCAISTRKDE